MLTEAGKVLSQLPDSNKLGLGSNFWYENKCLVWFILLSVCRKSHTRTHRTPSCDFPLVDAQHLNCVAAWWDILTFIHFVRITQINILTLSLTTRGDRASCILKPSFTATIIWQNNILSGTAWSALAFISSAMLFSHADGYMVTWWRAQAAQAGKDVWPQQHSFVLYALLFPDLPTWVSSVPPARPTQALCGAVKAGNVSRAIRSESHPQIHRYAEWSAARWPGTLPWMPLLLPPSAPVCTRNVVLGQAEGDVTFCRAPKQG